MMATLSGAAVSDGLADGRVVSGVGGQYNSVAMAHELEGARSILLLRAALPWLSLLVLFLVIVTYVPQLSLWLPERLF